MARADRHLHPSRLHTSCASRRLWRLLLPLPRLAIRHFRPRPPRSGTAKPRGPPLRLPLRQQDPDRLTFHTLQDSIMSGNSTYQPQGPCMRWIERRLPIGGLIHSSFVAYPTPRNLNYWWTFGGILSFIVVLQIVTGFVLAMHYM